jgi:hypothetical protein
MPKALQIDIDLHKLILAKDDLALVKLFDRYGESVITKLKQWYPETAYKDHNLILGAVNEAFFGYYQNATSFNPALNSLQRFLEIAAERDLINFLKKEKKHYTKRINNPNSVELQEQIWNSAIDEGENPEYRLIQNEVLDKVQRLLKGYFSNSNDLELAKMILMNERKTEVFAEMLQLTEKEKTEQEKIVKRHKDRIKKILQRNDIEEKLKRLLS